MPTLDQVASRFSARILAASAIALGCCGCPSTQSLPDQAAVLEMTEDRTKCEYLLYVPSIYSADRSWLDTREFEIVWEYLNPFGGEEHLGPPPRRDRNPDAGDDPRPPGAPERDGAGPPRRDGGRPPGPPGRPGGGDRGGGRSNMIPHGLFRATRIAPDHPGLKGRL